MPVTALAFSDNGVTDHARSTLDQPGMG